MLNIIDEKLEQIRTAAADQQACIINELNANVDATNAAMARFSAAMKQAHAKRDEARQIEQAAVRDLDTALNNSQTVQLALMQQLDSGQIVGGSNTPAVARKPPKLKVAGEV